MKEHVKSLKEWNLQSKFPRLLVDYFVQKFNDVQWCSVFAVFLSPLFLCCYCCCGSHFKDKLFKCPPEKEGAAFEGDTEMVFLKWSQSLLPISASQHNPATLTMLGLPLSVFLGFDIWLTRRELEATWIQLWNKAGKGKYRKWGCCTGRTVLAVCK